MVRARMDDRLTASRQFAEALVSQMTLTEKAGQLAQVSQDAITPAAVAEYAIGSVLSGGGGNPEPNSPAGWRRMVGEFLDAARRSRLGIPLLYGADAVHGHSNVVGATIFPHNIGLGASGAPDLVERVYRAAAVETAATGVRWDFAPTVAVSIDPRWGRCYESFGDDPELVARLGAAAVRGLHGAGLDRSDAVLACPKHFVGDGATTWGTAPRIEWTDWWTGWEPRWRIDQGDARIDEAELRSIHLLPYREAVAAGALTVMASYSSWNGEKLHGHRALLTGVLKGELGFAGFVVSDWLGVAQLDPDPYRCVVEAIGAGIDMVMIPFDYERFIADVVTAVERGDLPGERVDDAVGRILSVKHVAGLFADPPLPSPGIDLVGAAEHRALARQAAAASAVLLENRDGALPISDGTVLVAGAGADDVGLQCGGWTIEWQGGSGPITAGTTILGGLRDVPGLDVVYDPDGRFEVAGAAETGVVVLAEPPYAEGLGDREHLVLTEQDRQVLRRVRKRVDRLVLVLLSGRPLVLDDVAEHCDAIVAAWLPGTEGAGVVDVLTGRSPFTGRLPRRWPRHHLDVEDPFGEWEPAWRRGHSAASVP